MTNPSDEIHSDTDSSVGDTTPYSSPRSPPTDSESDFSISPTDSLFSDGIFEPNLEGPQPGEEAQYRGRKTHLIAQAPINPHHVPPAPAPAPEPAPEPEPAPAPPAAHPVHHHAGGANSTVVQGVAPFNPAEILPNPPDQH